MRTEFVNRRVPADPLGRWFTTGRGERDAPRGGGGGGGFNTVDEPGNDASDEPDGGRGGAGAEREAEEGGDGGAGGGGAGIEADVSLPAVGSPARPRPRDPPSSTNGAKMIMIPIGETKNAPIRHKTPTTFAGPP
jgi:hypothetical protein